MAEGDRPLATALAIPAVTDGGGPGSAQQGVERRSGTEEARGVCGTLSAPAVPSGLVGGGQLARITIPCVTRWQAARALPLTVEFSVTRIGASSPIWLDKTIQPTPIRGSDSIHTSAHEAESLNIPKLPEIMFPESHEVFATASCHSRKIHRCNHAITTGTCKSGKSQGLPLANLPSRTSFSVTLVVTATARARIP